MKQLFGTDGIRGKANQYPMTPELMVKLGKSIAKVCGNKKAKVLIGKDTRLSSYMLETALTSGLCSMGVDVKLVGVIPTPAVAHLAKSLNADFGIMISASHNPACDNGIKIFDKNGFKLKDEVEEMIEMFVLEDKEIDDLIENKKLGSLSVVKETRGRYISHANDTIGSLDLNGLKIVLDCANGAAYKVAPEIFTEAGAEVVVLNDKPNGNNINLDCGAMHPEVISEVVLREKADIGISLDGDADRVIVVDEKGKVVDGDHILAMCAIDMRNNGTLKNNTVVSTVMANIGFDIAMEKEDILVVRTKVGDRYVIQEMREGGYVLGGEQSGHIIFMNHSTTGDGIVSALQIVKLMKKSGKRLSELSKVMETTPQILINVKVKEKKCVDEMGSVKKIIKEVEEKLGKNGRVLVRYSGTELLCRVMVEGKNKTEIKLFGDKIAEEIKKQVGE